MMKLAFGKPLKRTAAFGVCLLGLFILFLSASAAYADTRIEMDIEADDDTVTAFLKPHEDMSVMSFQMEIRYDSEALELLDYHLGDDYRDMLNVANTETKGILIIAAASPDPVRSEGNVVKLEFKLMDPEVKQLSFDVCDTIIYDGEDNAIEYDDSRYEFTRESEAGSASGSDGEPSAGAGGEKTSSWVSTVSPAQPVFSDINDSWAKEYIERAYEYKLMEGYGNGIFGTSDLLTRAQMAQVLWNSAGRPEPASDAEYDDLTEDWYRKAIAWVTEQRMFQGYGEGIFAPDDNLTREQIMQVLFNMSGGSRGMEAMLTDVYDGRYTDSGEISPWAKQAVYWAVYNDVVCGTDSESVDNALYPASPVDRAQAAVMLVKYRNI